nr:MMPL family transporter [Oceanococcus sp. HetDA_MAG_MS8]
MAQRSLGHVVVRYQRWLLSSVALLTVLALASLLTFEGQQLGTRLRIDPAVDRLLDPNDPERDFQRQMEALFAERDPVILAVGEFPVLTSQGLATVEAIHERLQGLSQIREVRSLANAPLARDDADGSLLLDPVTRHPAGSKAQQEALRAAIQANPLLGEQLLSDDAQTAAFVLEFAQPPEDAFAAEDLIGLLKATVRESAPELDVWITGAAPIKVAVTQAVAAQFVWLIPLVLGLTGLITMLAFRSVRGALLTLAMVGTALVWVLALMVWMDTPLTLVSAIMPPVVITLGLAYAMHAQSDFLVRRMRHPDVDMDQATAASIDHLRLPLLLTAVTTMAGLLALLLNPLLAVREFALFSALGVAIDAVLALCVLPLLLAKVNCRPVRLAHQDRFDRVANTFAAFALKHRRLIVFLGVGILLAGLLSLSRLEVGTNYVRSFSAGHPVRTDFETINSKLAGVNVFSIVLEGFVADTFVEPDILRSVQVLQAWLEQQPEVGTSLSVVDHLQVIRRSLGDSVDEAAQIPDSAAVVKQLLLFGGGAELHQVVDRRLATARIVVRSYEDNSAAIASLLERLQPQLDKLPRRLEWRLAGDSVLLTKTVGEIVSGQWLTVGVAALVIFAVLAALFTSWRVAAMAMLPNLMPVAVYYGLLAALNIPLNPTTSLIACIVLGVAVDDTIHFLVRFNAASRQLADEAQAVAVALRGVLRPVTFTTVALCAGFACLALSPLQNQVQFGLLAAATLAFAWVSDVLFTPALGSGVRLVTLWDVLRLDLGADPQHSIPLFAGLSGRQARTFALMSRLIEVPAGERVIAEGDVAEDIYVIIDGQLRAYLERDEGERELSIMSRGTVMGEVGYFGQRRTASVRSLTPARLLLFNGTDLDILRARYPRIAATVYRNLNLTQAQRLANMAKMI